MERVGVGTRMTFLPENSSTEIARLKIASWDHATFHSQVWNRRQFVPRASFKTKTTTKALIGFHNPYFWILRHSLQPISIGPGGEKGSEKKLCITPVSSARSIKYYPKIIHLHLLSIFDGHLPTPFSFLWWIYCEKKYGGRKGMALPLLSQLPCN